MTRITLIVSAHCHLCEQAQQILDRLAREFSLDVEIVPLDSARGRDLATAARMVFPPALLIEGEPFSYGRLSERKLRRTLIQRAAA